MSKEKYFRMTMLIASIGIVVDIKNYIKIKKYLDELMKIADEDINHSDLKHAFRESDILNDDSAELINN